jgi:hypothetical protein
MPRAYSQISRYVVRRARVALAIIAAVLHTVKATEDTGVRARNRDAVVAAGGIKALCALLHAPTLQARENAAGVSACLFCHSSVTLYWC